MKNIVQKYQTHTHPYIGLQHTTVSMYCQFTVRSLRMKSEMTKLFQTICFWKKANPPQWWACHPSRCTFFWWLQSARSCHLPTNLLQRHPSCVPPADGRLVRRSLQFHRPTDDAPPTYRRIGSITNVFFFFFILWTVSTCNDCWFYVLAACQRLFELFVVLLINKNNGLHDSHLNL